MAGFQVEEKKERSFLQVVRTQFLQPLEKMSCHCMMNMAVEDWIMSHAAARLKSELIVLEGIHCPLSSDSVVCNFLNVSETTGLMETQFHMEPIQDG